MFLPFTIRNSNYLSFLRVLNRCNNSIYTCFPKYSYSTIKINYLYHRITDSLLIEPADTYGSPISTNRSPIISTDLHGYYMISYEYPMLYLQFTNPFCMFSILSLPHSLNSQFPIKGMKQLLRHCIA